MSCDPEKTQWSSLSDELLQHIAHAVSQYDSVCRNLAAENLCLRYALNRCASHGDLKVLHEQTRCAVCLTAELRDTTSALTVARAERATLEAELVDCERHRLDAEARLTALAAAGGPA